VERRLVGQVETKNISIYTALMNESKNRSPEWSYIPDGEKQVIGLTFDDDGEFWMSYRDFTRHFTRLEICNLAPKVVDDGFSKSWKMSSFEGKWVRGVTAGGCANYKGVLI
jgi:calpain, invertebrate